MLNVKSQTLQKLWSLYIQNNPQQSTDELIISVVNQLKNYDIHMNSQSMTQIWYIVCSLIRNNFDDTYTTIPREIKDKLCNKMEQKWFEIIDDEVREWIDDSGWVEEQNEEFEENEENILNNLIFSFIVDNEDDEDDEDDEDFTLEYLEKKRPDLYEKYMIEKQQRLEEHENGKEQRYEEYVNETKQHWAEDYWEGCKNVTKGSGPWGIEFHEIIDLGPELCLSIIKHEEFDWNNFWFDFDYQNLNDLNFGIFTSMLIGKI